MVDFDRVIDRRNTHSSKWDAIAQRSDLSGDEILPMWVADMDFPAPEGVTAALRAEIERGIHGYYADTGSWAEALGDWCERRHGWRPLREWISPTPGIVSGIGLALQAFSEPGDEVVVFPPAYHAFRKIIEANGRTILDVQLLEQNGRYAMDFDALRERLSPRSKVVLFCSPHNPGGTVWSAEEIRELAAICEERDLLLISDEIHCDLVFPGARHVPTIVAAPEIKDRLITCVAATKTFNLAGAHVGAMVTSNPELKRALDARVSASGLGSYNLFGMLATEAAWRTGEPWLEELIPYLAANRDRFDAAIEAAAPGARSMRLAATYLAWVDFSRTGLPAAEVARRIGKDAKIFASPGPQFGPGGETWARFNLATPRALIEEAISRLEHAFADLRG